MTEEEEADREYLVMLAETKTVICAYESEGMLKSYAQEIHSTQGQHKEALAAEKHVESAAMMRDHEIEIELPVSSIHHKVYPTHRNEN